MSAKKYAISFCIVCMNRLHQLTQTLLKNIADNADYDELEFIVLDYNSQDGMQEWVQLHAAAHIASGRVKYYHTTEPQAFSHSHSKNVAFKLASGDIVCNINADHYTGAGFASYINKQFNANPNSVLTTIDFHKTQKNYYPSKDVYGRVCVKKEDFLKIGGFDERMNGYGFEDYDFINRLELIGIQRVLIEDFTFLKYIAHDEEERYTLNTDNLHGLYVNYCEPSVSEVIFMYKDKQFEKGVLIDNASVNAADYTYAYRARNHRFEYTLQDPGWERGRWQEKGNHINFSSETGKGFTCTAGSYPGQTLVDSSRNVVFYAISDPETIKGVVVFNYFFYNRAIMEKNLDTGTVQANTADYGKALVFKNFQTQRSIQL